jgi:hypothetical protein
MSIESELKELIDVGRHILHEGCEQELCDEWREQCFQTLCELLGPHHELAKAFHGNECCEVKSLLIRANILAWVLELISVGHLPVIRAPLS